MALRTTAAHPPSLSPPGSTQRHDQASPASPADDAHYWLCLRDRAGVIRRFGHGRRGKRPAIAVARSCVSRVRSGGRLLDLESKDSIAVTEILARGAVDSRRRAVVAEFPLSKPGSSASDVP